MRSDTSRAIWGLAALLASASPAALMAAPAAALSADSSAVIPRMSLDRALLRIEQLTGARIRFDPDAARTRRSGRVTSTDPATAIRQALTGTTFLVDVAADGTYTVSDPAAGQDIVVTARRDEAETSFRVDGAQSSNRSGKSLRELPQATQVITSALIGQQQAQTVNEALRNSAGVVTDAGNLQGSPNFRVRGFSSTALQNGLATSGQSNPIDNVERIEVLKGPAAILSGAGGLGGLINIVEKRPSADPILDITAQYQTFDDKKLVVDASNALTVDKTVSARIVASVADAKRSDFGYDGRNEWLIAPSIRYKTANSDIIAGITKSSSRNSVGAYGLIDPATGQFYDLPERPIGPRNLALTNDTTRYHASAEQKVSSWLTLVARGDITRNTLFGPVYLPGGFFDPDRPTVLTALASRLDNRTTSHSADAYARLTFHTGPARHIVSIGYNHSDYDQTQYIGDQNLDAIVALDLSTDTTGAPQPPPTIMPASRTKQHQNGIYIQDYIDLGRLHVSAAVRRTRYLAKTTGYDIGFGPEQVFVEPAKATSPSFGAVFDVTREVSIYANYVKGFDQSSGLTCNGDRVPNRSTQNIEGGLKADLFRKRLSLVASVFRIRESNSTYPDFLCPIASDRVFIADGVQTKGVELNANGEILPGLGIAASYTYNDYKYLQPSEDVGTTPGQRYKHAYSAYVTYEARRGTLKGLGAAAGVFGSSRSFIDQFAQYTTPPRIQIDGNLTYRLGQARVNVGVKNLLDRRQYSTSGTINYVPIIQPRTVTASLTYSFF